MDLVEAKQRGFDEAGRHPWETARFDVVRKLISRYVRLANGAVVMDIGCGDTLLVERLAAEYPAVSFCAIDTALTDELISRYRTQLKTGNVRLFSSLETVAPLLERQVSLVLLADVIEHIEDLNRFLTNLLQRPWIGAETCFLITAPAYQSLFCSHDRFLGHYRRYSNRLLRKHVEESGLKVIEMGYFFFSLLPVRALQVIKEQIFNVKPEEGTTGLVTWSRGRATTAFLKRLLVLDAGLSLALKRIGITLAGLSNYAICRKSA